MSDMESKKIKASLRYVVKPSESQTEQFLDFLASRYAADKEDIEFTLIKDESILGGFILTAGDDEYDWSLEGRVKEIMSDADLDIRRHPGSSDIISVIKNAADSHIFLARGHETGHVIYCGDGIARIEGLSHVEYGEIIIFESGVRGMVLDIREDNVGCILFGTDDEVYEGEKAVRTGAAAGVPVGDAMLGRIVNALGDAIDEKGDIDTKEQLPVESPAPGIIDRQPVATPMETGILAIDSMFPIGRGQREL
ncbi:MAG: F0F1 ATP synthase subunit delta, partial [Lachnospiraceae bacterium]|nr:F0F1 ATP synthase subunit delta [Lachnospiraceae bacterium]